MLPVWWRQWNRAGQQWRNSCRCQWRSRYSPFIRTNFPKKQPGRYYWFAILMKSCQTSSHSIFVAPVRYIWSFPYPFPFYSKHVFSESKVNERGIHILLVLFFIAFAVLSYQSNKFKWSLHLLKAGSGMANPSYECGEVCKRWFRVKLITSCSCTNSGLPWEYFDVKL